MSAAENHGNGNSELVFVKVKSDTMKGSSLNLTENRSAHRSLFFSRLASLHGPLLLHVSSNTHTTMLMFLSVVIDSTIEKNSVFYCDKHPLGNFLFLHSRNRGGVPGASTDSLAQPRLHQIFRNTCSSAVCRKHCLPGRAYMVNGSPSSSFLLTPESHIIPRFHCLLTKAKSREETGTLNSEDFSVS